MSDNKTPTPDAPVEPDWLAKIERYSERYGRDATIGEIIADVAEERREWWRQHRPADGGAAQPTLRGWTPFPTERLPEPLARYVREASRAIGCDETYVALPMLSMLASCIGMTRRARLKASWREPCILWGAVVAPSGTRKTPALSAVLRPLQRAQSRAMQEHAEAMDLFEQARATYERDLAAWRKRGIGDPPVKPTEPTARRYIVGDITVEAVAPILLDNPRGVLLARDELSGWIGDLDRYAQSKGGDVARWLSAWSAEPLIVDRKTSGSIYVPHAAVSVCGTIQPAVIERVVGLALRENGFLARILLAQPPVRPGKWTDADVSPAAEDALARTVEGLLALEHGTDADGEPAPVDVPLADDARAAYIAWHDLHEDRIVAADGDLAAHLAKLRGICARLALLVQLARGVNGRADTSRIDSASVASASALADWFAGEAERIYSAFDAGEEDRETRRLIQWMERRGGEATVRDVTRALRAYPDADSAGAALGRIADAGLGRWEPSRGGRTLVLRLCRGTADSADTDTSGPDDPAKPQSVGVGSVGASDTTPAPDPEPDPGPARTPNMDRLAFAAAVHAPDRAGAVPAEWRAGVLPGVADNGQPWGAL